MKNFPVKLLSEYARQRIRQWCTTFFGQGPEIGFENLSLAKQVRQLSVCPNDKCTQKFTNMTCTVKHKVNIKSYKEMHP